MGKLDIDLALFGQRKAGKTVYLSMLVYEVRQRYNRSYFVRFNNPESERYVQDRIEQIVEHEQWPSGTPIEGDEPVVFDIVGHDNKHFVRYRTIDLPGEIIRGLFIPGTEGIIWRKELRKKLHPHNKYVKRICDLIDKSSSFMFLIDPKGDNDEKHRICDDTEQDLMCAEIIDEIIERKNITSPEEMPPIAFVFTKWDAYGEQFRDFDSYARKVLNITFGTHNKMLKRSAVMKCSAVGRTRVESVKDDNGSRKVRKPKRPIQPRGVAESLFWVIKNSNGIKVEGEHENGS